MPRSRRRHHSRSRSRSKSNSHERDPKRRRVENVDSPTQIKSDSNEETNQEIITPQTTEEVTSNIQDIEVVEDVEMKSDDEDKSVENTNTAQSSKDEDSDDSKDDEKEDNNDTSLDVSQIDDKEKDAKSPPKTPKALTPRQLKRKEEFEKKRLLKLHEKEERERKKREEREEREKKKQEEKEELERKKQKEKDEKIKLKNEKEEKLRLEREAKKKEKEDKRKEKEEQEELKRKVKEEKREMKHKEIEEKERRKQMEQELKEKAAKAFTQFFVPKKSDTSIVEEKKYEATNFMPFCVKPDMRLAPLVRRNLLQDEKENLINKIEMQSNDNYIQDLKSGKITKRASNKTWSVDEAENEDCMIIDENSQNGIIAQERKVEKMRAKVLQFSENRRPAYFGTWRKKSKNIKPRKPFALDTNNFDYEVDSDDDWEEEVQGESLEAGSDDEEKDNVSENDYEEDNEFFVPHGYLSEGEGDDEDNVPMSPEAHKAKLKLLKSTFEEEIHSKTERLKPVLIGCIWADKVGKVQSAFESILKARAMITNGTVEVRKRDLTFQTPLSNKKSLGERNKQQPKSLSKELIPTFLKLVHGNIKNQMFIINEFLNYLNANNIPVDLTKSMLGHQLKVLASWMKCPEEGPLHKKFCWYVSEEVRQQYNADLSIPNKWNYTLNS